MRAAAAELAARSKVSDLEPTPLRPVPTLRAERGAGGDGGEVHQQVVALQGVRVRVRVGVRDRDRVGVRVRVRVKVKVRLRLRLRVRVRVRVRINLEVAVNDHRLVQEV